MLLLLVKKLKELYGWNDFIILQVCLEIWAWPGEPTHALVQEGEVAQHKGGQQLEQTKARRLT